MSSTREVRSSEAKRLRNQYQRKTTRTFIKRLRKASSPEEAKGLYVKITSMLDRMAKKGVVHRSTASRQKSRLAHLLKALGSSS
ncbi:MAG: 30S ribosomal protein S20 [Cytophagales bacterium]|nr:30S ribosomal protein S20 [Cytophagales bacterium]